MRPKSLAQIGYDAYSKAVGGKAFNGDPLPDFADIPTKIKDAWLDASISIALEVRQRDRDNAVRFDSIVADLNGSA